MNFPEIAVLALHELRRLPSLEIQPEFKFSNEVFTKYQGMKGNFSGKSENGSNRICKDRISELPDCILLHIMNFMDTKDVVRTCVLSKRWKDLCKRLTNLTFSRNCCRNLEKFVSWVLFSRDNSYSLHGLSIRTWTCPMHGELLERVIKHALLHNVQYLSLDFGSGIGLDIECFSLIFCSHSLKSLKLSSWSINPVTEIQSFHLSALKVLHLYNVEFSARYTNSAEPFSNCRVLKTLVLGHYCSLDNDAKVLCISNSTLSNLTILGLHAYDIVLSTPSLSSFTIDGFVSHQLYSTCNLSFLEEVNIVICWRTTSILMTWLDVLANAKTLRISLFVVLLMLDLSNSISMIPQPPNFVRLESLKVIEPSNVETDPDISYENVDKAAKFLLQNTPMGRVQIIRNAS